MYDPEERLAGGLVKEGGSLSKVYDPEEMLAAGLTKEGSKMCDLE
jgi:hypothetical protein